MCLILFAYHAHEKYKLIVAANRDEFYNRPTAPVHYWEDHRSILAGRDLARMGTWMGVTTSGRFASLTNYRDPKEMSAGKRSRGELVADYLINKVRPEDYLQELVPKRHSYPGYNVLVGDANDLYYYSNVEDKIQQLRPGVHGLSNHLLNTEWPKVVRGREGLSRAIEGNHHVQDLTERIMQVLQESDPAPDEWLPQTGISREWERMLSPIYIKSDGYGTRSSTVLLVTDEGFHLTEQVYSKEGIKSQHYAVTITPD